MPSSSGMSTSSVTRSGSSAWTCFSASNPLRAVPTTRNSPDRSRTSVMTLRMNALSSTTRTVRRWARRAGASEDTVPSLEGAYLDATIRQVEHDRAAVRGTRLFTDERNAGVVQRLTRGEHVALADIDAAPRNQVGEHARAANQTRGHAQSPSAKP